MNNAPDVEIYVANIDTATAQNWLESIFQNVEGLPKKKGMPKNAASYRLTWQHSSFVAMVVEQSVKGFTSIWFDCSELPWANDLECAKMATLFFNKGVRVTAGGWQDDADPDAWVEVSPNGDTHQIIWKTN